MTLILPMGIPCYFKQVIRTYRNVMIEYTEQNTVIHNLYLDAQSIIYDSVQSLDPSIDYEQRLIQEVVKKIGHYINTIHPTEKVMISFDGVAPAAKLSQQQTRRYKSAIEKQIYTQSGVPMPERWNTSLITPGTAFMQSLSEYVINHFIHPKKYGIKEFIITTSNDPGEGEHKIFEYIRENISYHRKTTTAIYGLDSDLIMLTLNHTLYTKQLYLYRETPHYIQSIDSTLKPNVNYVIDIHAMAIAVSKELGDKDNPEQCVPDYIFLCFFLGNDFLPHFPCMNLRTNGLPYLTTMYKKVVNTHGHLISSKGIVWKNVRELIHLLSNHEEEWFKHEHTVRNKCMKQIELNPLNDIPTSLQNLPITDRRTEQYINPFEDGWRERYYHSLLHSQRTECMKKQVSIHYLEGLEWTYKYYTFGCPDWEWMYPYNYPPLLCDLKEHVPTTCTEWIPLNPKPSISPNVQLAYVLHPSCLHYLPDNLREILLQTHPEWYDESRISVEYAYCRYFWEGHVNSPIRLSTLQQLIQ